MSKITKISFLIYVSLCFGIVSALLMPRLVVRYDGAVHVAIFVLLTLWPVMAVTTLRQTLMVALGLIFAGALVEFLQRYSPERTASFMDFGMNVIGVLVGLMAGLLLRRKYQTLHA
jgi:VanZ family protein